jgi:hypothetical protein
MKFLLSATLAVIILTATATAQRASFGIKGGLNLYNIHNSSGPVYDPVVGIHAGFLSHIHLTDHFALQPEAFFSINGAVYNNGNNSFRYHFGYVNIPVLLQYMFNNGFRLQAGPQLSFLTHAVVKDNSVKENISNDLNSVDFGLTTGASYQVPNTGLGFDARFNLGLTDINKNGTITSTNRGGQLGVFYLFKRK